MVSQANAATRKLRVAFVLPSFAGGGAQRTMIALAASLDRALFDPMMIVFEDTGPWRPYVPQDIAVHSLGRRGVRASLPSLVMALRKHRPDVAVSTMAYVNAGLLLLRPAISGNTRLFVREANAMKHHSTGLLGRA